MPDIRFFPAPTPLSLGKIAELIGASLPPEADRQKVFKDVASLNEATNQDVSWAFISSKRAELKETKAGAVIVPEKFLSLVPQGCVALVVKDAQRSYGILANTFYPRRFEAGISPKAVVDETAQIGAGSRIEAGAVVGAGVVLGKRCLVEANAVIGENVVFGDDCTIGATATVSHCLAGNKVYIYPGAHIGQDGFGFSMTAEGPVKLPQLGRVIIGDDVEIGSCTTVDRGAMGDTKIGSGCRIDNLVQIGHNVKLGRCCVLVSQVGVAGSCSFGDFVVAGGQVGFAGHLKIGSGAKIAAQSGLMSDVSEKAVMMGSPAMPHLEYMRQVVALKGLTKKKDGKPKFSWKVFAYNFLRGKKG